MPHPRIFSGLDFDPAEVGALEAFDGGSSVVEHEVTLGGVADAWSRPLMAAAAVLALGSNADAALAGYIVGSALVVLAMRAVMRLEGAGERQMHPLDMIVMSDTGGTSSLVYDKAMMRQAFGLRVYTRDDD